MGSASLTVLLLSVLLALEITVHSRTYPYISFMGVALRNNSYVNVNLVGDNSTNSVQCHTDLTTCCTPAEGIHRGDWFFPGGIALRYKNGGHRLYMHRSAQRVELRRKKNSNLNSKGLYQCSIDTTAASDRMFVYVGLYASGGKLHHS